MFKRIFHRNQILPIQNKKNPSHRGPTSAKSPRGLTSWKHWIPAFAGMTIAILAFTFSLSLYPEPVEGALVGVSRTGSSSPLTNGLVGYWTFDGKDIVRGVLQDKSGNGNNGNLINIATSTFFAQGKIGQAGKFDGSNDYVNVANNPISSMSNPNSACMWIRLDDVTKAGGGGGSQTPFVLFTNASNHVRIASDSAVGPGTAVVTIDSNGTVVGRRTTLKFLSKKWTHICYSWDSTNLFVYMNGTRSDSSDAVFADPTGNFLGRYSGSAGYLAGSIDDVRIYNRALSSQEIKDLYNLGGSKIAVSQKVATSSPSTGSGQPNLSAGLVGYWTFDGKDIVRGVLQDKSGNGNNGNLISIATSTFFAQGKIGQAGKFDGGNDYTLINDNSKYSVVTTNQLAFSFWAKPSSGSGNGYILIKGNEPGSQWEWRVAQISDTIGVTIWSIAGSDELSVNSSAGSFSANKWHHVVVTVNNVAHILNIYIDGVLSGSDTTSAGLTLGDGTSGVAIGRRKSSTYFLGLIDDVRIYNRALSPTEIKDLYNLGGSKMAVSQKIATSSPSTPSTSSGQANLSSGLVGYWTFDGKDVIRGVLQDKSGNGNNGNLISIATSTFFAQGKIGQAGKFDGGNDYVSAGTIVALDSASQATICGWIKRVSTTAVVSFGTSASGSYRFNIQWKNDGKIYLTFANGVATQYGSVSLTGVGWHYVCNVFNGSLLDNARVAFYIDGTSRTLSYNNTPPATLAANANQGVFLIGRDVAINNYSSGSIDDVRIYNRALSAQEIKQLYNLGR